MTLARLPQLAALAALATALVIVVRTASQAGVADPQVALRSTGASRFYSPIHSPGGPDCMQEN